MHRTSKSLAECSNVAHGFFGRKGGASEGIYASLNCGPGSKDDPAHVAENRRRVMEALGAQSLVTLSQIHSNHVTVIPAKAGILSKYQETIPAFAGMTVKEVLQTKPEADALVTNQPGIALGMLTADCGPVLFADPKARIIGAAHAGWKGATSGILENTLDAMVSLGAKRERIIAALGPTIAQASYEVGEEFKEKFSKEEQAMFFVPTPALPRKREREPHAPPPPTYGGRLGGGQYYDLPAYIIYRLKQSGVTIIDNLAIDTYENDYFSYRRTTHRGEPDYGRQISCILLKETL